MEDNELNVLVDLASFLKREDFHQIIKGFLCEEEVKYYGSDLGCSDGVANNNQNVNGVRVISTKSVFDSKVYGPRKDRRIRTTIFDLMRKDGNFGSNISSHIHQLSKAVPRPSSSCSHRVAATKESQQKVDETVLHASSSKPETSQKHHTPQTKWALQRIRLKYFGQVRSKKNAGTLQKPSSNDSDVAVDRAGKGPIIVPSEKVCEVESAIESKSSSAPKHPVDTEIKLSHGRVDKRSFDSNEAFSFLDKRQKLNDGHDKVEKGGNIEINEVRELVRLTSPVQRVLNDMAEGNEKKKEIVKSVRSLISENINVEIDSDKEQLKGKAYESNNTSLKTAVGDRTVRKNNKMCLESENERLDELVYPNKDSKAEGTKRQLAEPCFCTFLKLPRCDLTKSEQKQKCFHVLPSSSFKERSGNIKQMQTCHGVVKSIKERGNFHEEYANTEEVIATLVSAQRSCFTVTPRGGAEYEMMLQSQAEARRDRKLSKKGTTSERFFEYNVRFIENEIHGTVRFAKKIPGFRRLHLDDQVSLIRDSRLDGSLLSVQRSSNPDLRIVTLLPGEHAGFEDFETAVGKEFIDAVSKHGRKMIKLDITEEEEALYRAVVITTSDRCEILRDKALIEELHSQLVDVFVDVVKRNSVNVGKRLGDLIDFMTTSRNVSDNQLTSLKKVLTETPVFYNNPSV